MDSADLDRLLALIWAEFGYVLARFPYVKPPKNPPPKLPSQFCINNHPERNWVGGSLLGKSLWGGISAWGQFWGWIWGVIWDPFGGSLTPVYPPAPTPITFIIVPMVNNLSAPGQKHGLRGKSSFFHQIIFVL
jgi:hypothetical protein